MLTQTMLLIPDCIPFDVWASEILLQMLDARDLMNLGAARADLVRIPPGERSSFVAARPINAIELAWFAAMHIPVTMLVECEEYVELRVNGKAVRGSVKWCLNGQMHRDDDLPAWEWYWQGGGACKWFRHGKPHRDIDKPAVVFSTVESGLGTQEWWLDGKRHREGDAPAVVYANGDREWWVDGKRHRGGQMPALIRSTDAQWWEFGDRVY
jgi:hypothetical protein